MNIDIDTLYYIYNVYVYIYIIGSGADQQSAEVRKRETGRNSQTK
jgi:hypothetical protein